MRTEKMFRIAARVSLLTLLLVLPAFPQQRWTRTYGGPSFEYGWHVQQTSDGGYIITGETESYGAGNGDVFLIKTDAFGDTLWTKTYGGTLNDWGSSVAQTTDRGYIIAGWTLSYGAGVRDVYFIKTNAFGDTLWTKTYGGQSDDYGESVQQTKDGGYIIAGVTNSYGNGTQVYLIKTNAGGDTIWTRNYGGLGSDYGYFVQQTQDGGYIVAGQTNSFGNGSQGYLIKTDIYGDTLWTKTYGGSGEEGFWSVQQTADRGYIVAGVTTSYGAGTYDIYLIKTNAFGDTLWMKTYGGTRTDWGLSVVQTLDGGYIVAGYTACFGAGNNDAYLVKTNASGDTLWTRTYGGTDNDWCNTIQQTQDGGYIIEGYTFSFGGGLTDIYLIKTDANGNVGVEERPEARGQSLEVRIRPRPNPFTSFATVPGHEADRFALYDISGRRVGTYKGDRVGEGLVPGVYFVRAEGKGKPVRVVKVR